MSRRSRIHSLHDMESKKQQQQQGDEQRAKTHRSLPQREMLVASLTMLDQADHAAALLYRIYQEFFPIIQRRCYAVRSVSELCCCGDGLDHLQQRNQHHSFRRRITRRKQADNILGYNLTTSQQGGSYSSHTIHLRLRRADNHNIFFSYEDIAGTMSHELAHCEVSAHNATFYKLMNEIQEQHAVFITKGIVADTAGFPMNSTQAHVLGGNRTLGKNNSAASAALARQRNRPQWMPQGPQKLGGASKALHAFITLGEAAGNAAEKRRRADELWCMPCEVEPPMLEWWSDEVPPRDTDNAVKNIPTTQKGKDKERKLSARTSPTSPIYIDLTLDEEMRPLKRPLLSLPVNHCSHCTFINTIQALACTLCGQELQCSIRVVQQMVRNDAIDACQELEVKRSNADFGFNIYGNKKQVSSQRKNLT